MSNLRVFCLIIKFIFSVTLIFLIKKVHVHFSRLNNVPNKLNLMIKQKAPRFDIICKGSKKYKTQKMNARFKVVMYSCRFMSYV